MPEANANPAQQKSTITVCSYDKDLIPFKATTGAYCADIKNDKEFTIQPGEVLAVDTGVRVAMPEGIVCKMYARSSLPKKVGLSLANWVGIVDSDYRGDLKMLLTNITKEPITVSAHTRLCQISFEESLFYAGDTPTIEYIESEETYNNFEHRYPTARWAWGIGSTGQ